MDSAGECGKKLKFVRMSTDRGEDRGEDWGEEPFWGLGYEWDPDWLLTERQKELRAKLIDLCEGEMRANAKRSDDELSYPRRNSRSWPRTGSWL